jgi:hypothetical protein
MFTPELATASYLGLSNQSPTQQTNSFMQELEHDQYHQSSANVNSVSLAIACACQMTNRQTYTPYTNRNHQQHTKEEHRDENYIDQISGYLCSDKQIKFTAEDIARYAKSRSDWSQFVAAPNQPDRW